MTFKIKDLARSNIRNLTPYQSARRIGGCGKIFLNANESSTFSIFKMTCNKFNRYPENQPELLISNYARFVNLVSKQILVTRGADEGIELLIRAFCEPKKNKIICCPPTYDMYHVSANIIGVKIINISLKENWQLDLKRISYIIDNNDIFKVKIIYLCRPNNPTGNLLEYQDVISILKLSLNKMLVVIDEAYIEFVLLDSLVYLIEQYPHLVILRTLSKAFALAGLRCGFVLSNHNIINLLSNMIAPYPIATPVIDIAVQALNDKGIILMKNRVLDIVSSRVWLLHALKRLSCVQKIFPSVTNYVLVKFFNSKSIFCTLWKKGIILRDQTHKVNLKNCIRISIGTYDECKQVILALKAL